MLGFDILLKQANPANPTNFYGKTNWCYFDKQKKNMKLFFG